MKKLYTSLAAVAFAASTAFAARPVNAVPVVSLNELQNPYQSVVKFNEYSSSDAAINGVNMKNTNAGTPRKADDNASVKDYVTLYTPFFSNWDSSKTVTQNMTVTINADNSVEIDGFGGIGVKTSAGTSLTNVANLKGTYDPETKTISVPEKQIVGKYNGNDIAITFGKTDDETGSLYYAPFELKENAEGQLVFVSEYDLVYWYISNLGGFQAYVNPSINPANGKISYNWQASETLSGTIDEPFYYAIVTKGKNKYLRTSNLANRVGEGYMVDWVINEANKTATANNAACFNDPQAGNFILQSTTDVKTFSSTVTADISNTSQIVFPVGAYWCTMSAGESWFGLNAPATITGTPVELTEEAEETPLYVAGDFNSWDMNTPVQMAYDKENEVYSYTFPTGISEFGLSTGFGSGAAFDAGSIAIVNDEKVTDNTGETKYKLENRLENVYFGYSEGQWTVYVDLVNMQLWATNEVSGIENVTIGNDTPAVYYNLQGIQVANPVSGNLYIKRQGNDVKKVIVK